jgi:transposase-like protein
VIYSDGHIRVEGRPQKKAEEFKHVNGYAKITRAEFFALMESGKTITEIARMYEMDYSSLWAKAKRFGFRVDSTAESNRKRALVPWDVIVKDFEELRQYQLVARKHGIPSGNLRKRLLRNGLVPNEPWPVGNRSKYPGVISQVAT